MKNWFILGVIFLMNCTPDRLFDAAEPVVPIGGADNILPGTLKINEFMASGSLFANELEPQGADWLEIYNTTLDTIPLEGGKWYLTDSLADPELFLLPDTFILPQSYLIVWCDDQDTTITQIHSNFGLSKNGEDIGLFYKNSGSLVEIDSYVYPLQTTGSSSGRMPDGSSNWTFFTSPTPQAPNQ